MQPVSEMHGLWCLHASSRLVSVCHCVCLRLQLPECILYMNANVHGSVALVFVVPWSLCLMSSSEWHKDVRICASAAPTLVKLNVLNEPDPRPAPWTALHPWYIQSYDFLTHCFIFFSAPPPLARSDQRTDDSMTIDTTLLVHFFGKKGKAELTFDDFYRYLTLMMHWWCTDDDDDALNRYCLLAICNVPKFWKLLFAFTQNGLKLINLNKMLLH